MRMQAASVGLLSGGKIFLSTHTHTCTHTNVCTQTHRGLFEHLNAQKKKVDFIFLYVSCARVGLMVHCSDGVGEDLIKCSGKISDSSTPVKFLSLVYGCRTAPMTSFQMASGWLSLATILISHPELMHL